MSGFRDSVYKNFLDFKILSWTLFALFFTLTLLPTPPLARKQFPIDKIFHAAAYFFLTLSFREGYKKVPSYLIAALLGLTGAIIEIAQAALPWREASLGDLIADLAGIIVALPIRRKFLFNVWEMTATVFYLGRSKVAPGTLTSLVVVLIYGILPITSKSLIFIVPPLLLLSFWVSSLMEEKYGHDPPRVTIDEAIGVLIAFQNFRYLETLFHKEQPGPPGWSWNSPRRCTGRHPGQSGDNSH